MLWSANTLVQCRRSDSFFKNEPRPVRGSSFLELYILKPSFRIVADGAGITALINDRLLLLRTMDKPGMESDEFELRIVEV
jgi:hypothetical protein